MKPITVKGKTRLISQLKTTMPFRQEVGWAALRSRSEAGFSDLPFPRECPVLITVWFYFAPPKKMPKGRVKPVVYPDADKLARAVFDAMKGVLYNDDGQVTDLVVRKRYDPLPRAFITVEECLD